VRRSGEKNDGSVWEERELVWDQGVPGEGDDDDCVEMVGDALGRGLELDGGTKVCSACV
jgi:hypothetical protein